MIASAVSCAGNCCKSVSFRYVECAKVCAGKKLTH